MTYLITDTWIVSCDVCNSNIDKLDQDEGVYVVGDSENVCSEKCVEQILGKETFTEAKQEWEREGDSRSYYWTYYEEKEE
tara:strand:+ start:45 stop:284 length:240 start_codon:yes stop_codon:yes gene_type:complete